MSLLDKGHLLLTVIWVVSAPLVCFVVTIATREPGSQANFVVECLKLSPSDLQMDESMRLLRIPYFIDQHGFVTTSGK